MAVDTILNTAAPLQTTPPSAVKRPDGIHKNTQDSKMTTNVIDIKQPDTDGDGRGRKIKSSPQSPNKSDQDSNVAAKNESNSWRTGKENANAAKGEKVRESSTKINTMKSNKIGTRPAIVTKAKDVVKNAKVAKDNEANSNVNNKMKENVGERVAKTTKIIPAKWSSKEDGASSDESSTEYVTFDDYLDKVSNEKSPERKHCFNKLDSADAMSLPIKPSSSSSSISSSISTIVMNETPQSPGLENSTFDAKPFRTSLVEASELPPQEILLKLFRERDTAESNLVCAWSPSVTTPSSSLEFKLTNVPKLTSKRSQYNSQNVPNVPRMQRSLTMTQREENVNNSFTVPTVYDRLASIGRYREFCFEHRPDDWQWYMKEYNATLTVGRVGVKKRKKQLKFGVNVPDPYATMGKRIVSNSNFDSRQNTFVQGESSTSRERQQRKNKNAEEVTTSVSNKDEDPAARKDRGYPVLAQTRDANPVNNKGTISSRSENTANKSTVSDTEDKRNTITGHTNNNNNNSNNNSNNNNNNNNVSSRSQPKRPPPPHPHHPGIPHLSGEDVKLILTSNKIAHPRNYHELHDNNDDEGEEQQEEDEEEQEKLWQNPFPSPIKSRANGTSQNETRTHNATSNGKSKVGKFVTLKEENCDKNGEDSHSNISVQPFVSDGRPNKTKATTTSTSKSDCAESKKPSHHLKAELERENDGNLMVKISVFNREKTKIKIPTNDPSVGKEKKKVRIIREESMLMGKELHKKLKSLNHGELSKNETKILSSEKGESNYVKDNKNTMSKITEIRQGGENDFKSPVNKKSMKSQRKDDRCELQGTEFRRKKPKSKSVLREKKGVDLGLDLDNADHYPRHRTAYQEIEYIGNNNMLKAKPTIKYTKSKADGSDVDAQNKDTASTGKTPLRHTVLIRSSTVHLTPEVDLLESANDVVVGRNVHQVYPLNDWKKTVDQGRCGLIVKSFPADNKDGGMSNMAANSTEHKTSNSNVGHANTTTTTKKPRFRNENPAVFLTTKSQDNAFSDSDNDPFFDNDNNNDDNNNINKNNNNSNKILKQPFIFPTSASLDILTASSLPTASTNVEKQPKSHTKAARSLYRSKPELPSIKVSTDARHDVISDDPPTSNTTKSYHFPPINPSEKMPDKQKALDDLFVAGVNHDRSRLRDNSFVLRKRPVSLDRGIIDDIVRYHTETTSIGFKHQQNNYSHLHTNLQISHPHHPSSTHHPFFSSNYHQNPQSFKPQPEESPSLTPSVHKISKVQAPPPKPLPRPKSPRDDDCIVTSSVTESRDLDQKREMKIYAHVRKNYNTITTSHSQSHDDMGSENSGLMTNKPPRHLPDLQHFLDKIP